MNNVPIPKKFQPHILGVNTSYLVDILGELRGMNRIDLAQFMKDVNPELVIRQRGGLEEDTSVLQILPYIIVGRGTTDTLLHDLKIITYRRGNNGGEAKLAGKGSCGFGGHVDLADVVSTDSIIDLASTIGVCAARELQEELGLSPELALSILEGDVHYYGMITDCSNAVGSVHLVMVFLYLLDPSVELFPEEGLTILGEFTAQELLTAQTGNDLELENWSAIFAKDVVDREILAVRSVSFPG